MRLNHREIIDNLRAFMREEGLDFFLISSTDEYFNEYISLSENSGYILSGFSGSTGEWLVSSDNVFLFVDGRYHLQADNETDSSLISVEKVGMDKTLFGAMLEKILLLAKNGQQIGIIANKTSVSQFEKLQEELEIKNIKLCDYDYDPVLKFANPEKQETISRLRYIPLDITGCSSDEKLDVLTKQLNRDNLDFFILTKLDEIAYLTNLRGNEIPYSSSFKAKAILSKDKALIFVNLDKISDEIKAKFSEKFEFKRENEFLDYLKNLSNIGYNPKTTNLLTYKILKSLDKKLISYENSPIIQMMSVKNPAEANYIKECFKKSDIVISRAISWLNQSLEAGKLISEKDFSDKVKSFFFEEGALGLSFEVIAASGRNTAFIHYTKPDAEKIIKMGELILLDCGAYYEGGYATDTTRTFLAGGFKAKADSKQKEIYTKVLKAFLNGLNFDLKENSTGFDIDYKVREIVNNELEEGFKFNHGTGHGIGISTHEALPRISPAQASKITLESGMFFSIEPGLYNDNWGGVRLENVVCVINTETGKRLQTMTKCRFDENLIDYNILDEQEIQWLRDYQKKRQVKMQEITSVQNPIIKEVHSLQQKKNRNELGLFLIEGYKGVSEAIKSNINIKNVFISYEFSDNLENIDKNKIYRVNEHILKKISTTETPPEIVASAYKPEYKLQDLFKEENFLILLLDNIKDPGNLGTIIRTAKASNVSGIILTDESVDIYNPKTVRSSAGNLWKLPVISMPDKINIKNNLNKIKNSEFIATAVAKNQSSQLYYDIDYKKPAVLMFGSEAQGLSAELINQADKFINIPMNSEVESLNLSVSVGVVLYEAMRQRQFSK